MNTSRHLAQLFWQPGRHMDDGWWDVLEMSAWRAAYRQHPACRASIDQQLVMRRGWPDSENPSAPDLVCVPPKGETARVMLRMVPSLRRVAIAYGVRMLGCPDYLLLGAYRRALAPWLDAWQCDRLLLSRREWPSRTGCTPEQVARVALAATAACLDATQEAATALALPAQDTTTLGMAMRILLPPPDDSRLRQADVPAADAIWPRLAALEKMLCMSSTLP